MTKLRLVPRDDGADTLFWLGKARRILSFDPVERDAALAHFTRTQHSPLPCLLLIANAPDGPLRKSKPSLREPS